MRVAVVVPAFDAGDRLARVLDTLPSWIDRAIVVDDGSARAVAVAPGPGRVVVRHDRNRGVGAAILTGFDEARRGGADVAVVMGADGQMDPADLPALLGPLAGDEADLVKGDRLSHPDCGRVMPPMRRFGNCCLTFLTRVACGTWNLTDSQCGYVAVRLDALDRLPLGWLYPRYGFPNDLLAAAYGAGLRVRERVVAPVYGGEPSGIRPGVAALVYPLILARAPWLRALAAFRRLPRGEATRCGS